MKDYNSEEYREMLRSIALCCIPEAQPKKAKVVENIVGQILLNLDDGDGLTSGQMASIVRNSQFLPSLTKAYLQVILREMVENKKLLSISNGYGLTDNFRAQLIESKENKTELFDIVFKKLFPILNDDEVDLTVQTFFEAVALLFLKLGNSCVSILPKSVSDRAAIQVPEVEERHWIEFVTNQLGKEYPALNTYELKVALTTLLEKNDPDFREFIWHIAQSYFIFSALRTDKSRDILSPDIFNGAVFYLDTNVLIHGLDPDFDDHEEFLFFVQHCRKRRIKIRAADISLDEMNKWLSYEKQHFETTWSAVPKALKKEFRSALARKAVSMEKRGEQVTAKSLFAWFEHPEMSLKQAHQISICEGPWNDGTIDPKSIVTWAKILENDHHNRWGQSRPKYRAACEHDVALLFGIAEERKQLQDSRCWLITIDKTLASSELNRKVDAEDIVINLSRILQWFSITDSISVQDIDRKVLFLKMIKDQLLPTSRIWDIEDFIVFSQLNIDIENQPPEKIRGCIEEIRPMMLKLDPLVAEHRERIAEVVVRWISRTPDELAHHLAKAQNVVQHYGDVIEALMDKNDECERVRAENSRLLLINQMIKKASSIKAIIAFIFLYLVFFIIFFYICRVEDPDGGYFAFISRHYSFLFGAPLVLAIFPLIILGISPIPPILSKIIRRIED